MNDRNWLSGAILTLLVLLSAASAHAAEVYYLGGQPAADGSTREVSREYTTAERVNDLFDFASYGDYAKERSGQITGSFLAEMDWNHTSGNISKSFLERGTDYLLETNVNIWQKLWDDYRFFFRKTDDRRIERMRDVRMKDVNARIYNPDHLVEFGDVYADFSSFTMGSSLEGLRGDFNPHRDSALDPRIQFVAARSQKEDVAGALYERHVFGGKYDVRFWKDQGPFSVVRIGAQMATSQDDSSTGARQSASGTAAADLNNAVGGFDGEVSFKEHYNFRWEWARSAFTSDEDTVGHDNLWGSALRLEPSFRSKYMNFRYLYYHVQPDFRSETGSASSDKSQHQFTTDLIVSPRLRATLVENWYWDHLDHSTRTYRTIHDEKYLTVYMKPLEERRSLDVRTYYNFFDENSDDDAESVDNTTATAGLSVNDRVWDANVGARYEYRAYRDRADRSRIDTFNRMGANISRDFELFGRRWYNSADASLDFRNPKNEDDNDINAGVSLSGQYDLMENLDIRYGYNLQESAAAAPDAGYMNTRSYVEADVLIAKKRNTHWISKIERNVYNHENGEQDYNETRVISKLVSQF
ncbi:MAG: hypothetical protein HQL11_02465 [Candidatus Omnitrophica bacterium]|nr:hypothetical protein [Candidatus Omnitrophota bacterium]